MVKITSFFLAGIYFYMYNINVQIGFILCGLCVTGINGTNASILLTSGDVYLGKG